MVILDRPDRGYQCLLTTAVVRGTAKIPRNQFVPVSIDAVPGARLNEDMLLVILANDAGWGVAMGRTDAVPGSVTCHTTTALRHSPVPHQPDCLLRMHSASMRTSGLLPQAYCSGLSCPAAWRVASHI